MIHQVQVVAAAYFGPGTYAGVRIERGSWKRDGGAHLLKGWKNML